MSRKKEHRAHWSPLNLSSSFGFKKRPKCLVLTCNQKKNVEKGKQERKEEKERNEGRKEGREKERKIKIPDEY